MITLQTELNQRWSAMFTTLAAGGDLAPAERLRTEGMMEAAVLLEIATPAELLRAMDESYQLAYGRYIAEDFGEDWQAFFPFPEIPAMGVRAPVYPSTSD
jgi:hypothetical protein